MNDCGTEFILLLCNFERFTVRIHRNWKESLAEQKVQLNSIYLYSFELQLKEVTQYRNNGLQKTSQGFCKCR